MNQKIGDQRGRQYPSSPESIDEKTPSGPVLTRISQIVYFDERASFSDYISTFKTPQTKIFLVPNSGCVTAFFDYHAIGKDGVPVPGHLAHQATKTSLFSDEWLKWRGMLDTELESGNFLNILQDFVPFIEDAGMDKLDQFLLSASAISGRELRNLRLLPSGATLVDYRRAGKRPAASSRVEFPRELWLNAPIVAGGRHVLVTIQLCYRIAKDGLIVCPRIFEREGIERAALREIREDLAKELGMPVFIGDPSTGVQEHTARWTKTAPLPPLGAAPPDSPSPTEAGTQSELDRTGRLGRPSGAPR